METEYRILDGKDMTDRQLLQAAALDHKVYPREYWLEEQTVLGYLHARPEIYTYAVIGDNLIGYLNMSCIDRKSYMTLLDGEENDLCIDASNILYPEAGQENYLYFSSIVVDPDHRKAGIAGSLFSRFGEKLTYLRRKGIYFTDVIADAISIHGEKLCLSFGMKLEKVTSYGGKLFRYPMATGEPNKALDLFIKNLRGGNNGQAL